MIEADNKLIPQDVKDFAKALGELCAKHELSKFSGGFYPGFHSQWSGEMQFLWDSGRHDADAGKISLSASVRVQLDCPISYKDKVHYKELA